MIRKHVECFEEKAKNASYSALLPGDVERNKLTCRVRVEQSRNYTNDVQKGLVDCNSNKKDAKSFPVTFPCTGVFELEETINSKEPLIGTDLRCMDVKRTHIYACNTKLSSGEPRNLENNIGLKSMQFDKLEEAVPYIEKYSNVDIKCLLFHNSLGPDTAEITETHEGLFNRDLEQVSVTSGDLPLDFLSSVSDEMGVRKSFVSSSSEKPLSASLLDSSETNSGSNSVHPTLSKLSDDIPDSLRCLGEQSIQEIQYIDLPMPTREYKEKVPMLKLFEQAGFPQHFDEQSCKDKLDMNLNSPHKQDKCSPKHLKLACQKTEGYSGDAHCNLTPGLNESIKQVPCQSEENVHLTKVSSPSVTNQNVVSNPVCVSTPEEKVSPSQQNCEETFLISPIANGTYTISTSTPLPDSKNITFSIPVVEDVEVCPPKIAKNIELDQVNPKALTQSGKTVSGNTEAKLANIKPAVTPVHKSRRAEIISFPKPNFKNVKPKITTRPLLQPKEQTSTKIFPRSTPCLSSPSSSVNSPRTGSAKVFGKRSVVDQDSKPGTLKPPMQQIKNSFPSKVLHATTQAKNASYKALGTTVLKQTVEDGSSTSSTCSSATTSTHIRGIKVTEFNGDRAKALVKSSIFKSESVGLKSVHSAHLESPLGKPEMLINIQETDEEVFVSPSPFSGKTIQKETTTSFRSKILQPITKAQASTFVPTLRKGSNKNVMVSKLSTPHQGSQSEASGIDRKSPKGRTIIKASPAVLTKSLPRKVPLKRPVLRRTPSVSSVCSSQSEQSVFSGKSPVATGSIENEEAPLKFAHPSGALESQSSKSMGVKSKVQPLKQLQAVPKTKSVSTNQDIPKLTRALPLPRKPTDLGKNTLLYKGTPGLQASKYSPVEKNKQKTNQRSPCTQAHTFPDETQADQLAESRTKCEKQSGIILQLKQFLASSNRKFEALAMVIQNLLSQREETLKQRKDLSQELANLRGDLVISATACDNLEKERNDLRNAYEGVIQKLKEHHRSELEELEDKLKQFYSEECEKLQSVFIEEGEKYKTRLQAKVDELHTTHGNLKLDLETSHSEKIEEMKTAYEDSFSELKKTCELENRLLEDSLGEKQAALEKIIAELRSENESLKEKLRVEEEKKKLAKEKSNAKNPQLAYLEQELESLKAVMEIKNEKLHQQDKKLMQIERLVENNTTLVEKLNKYQQENEDLKARMDKHMALSRQLSSEQAVLQESLQKESNVNKRLSMENEELLWKLHNGDLCSPKKLSPTSPLPFQTSRNSGSFSSPTISPR